MPPEASYIFKHALIQDAAYQSLLKSKRQQLHHTIAQHLENYLSEMVETQPEIIAHHLTQAGQASQAIPYWHTAGQRAIERSASLEAMSHLRHGLELLITLPSSPERIQQELTLQIALGSAVLTTKGYAAPEVEKVYSRARELCQQVGETPQLSPVLFGLWLFHTVRAEYHIGRALGEQLVTLAQRAPDSVSLPQACHELGFTCFFMGKWSAGRALLEQGIAVYNSQKHGSYTVDIAGLDPGVTCRFYAAFVVWVMGYPGQSQKYRREAFTLA